MQKRKITTLPAFRRFLKRHGIDFSKWGRGATKTVERLFHEYLSGETTFVFKKKHLVRVVRRVQILMYHRTKKGIRYYLIEKRQVFRNGSVRVRSRTRSLSEKMTPTEDALITALRALKEELGVVGIDPRRLVRLKAAKRRRPWQSDSYPNLPSEHYGPRFKLELPARWYKREGYEEVQPDKTTEFRWQKIRKRK